MAYTEFYCDPTNGSNLNAGSANAAPVYTGVGDSDGTSVFTPSDGSTPANTVSVGMFASIYITAGATVAVFVGRITAVGAGVNGTITVSITAKSGTIPTASGGAHTITCVVGGYWQGPHAAVAFPFAFITNTLTDSAGDYPRVNFINNATFSITSGITHANTGPIVFQGCTSTPGDLGRWILDGGSSTIVLLTLSGTNSFLRDAVIQNNGASGTNAGFAVSGVRSVIERVTVHAVRGAGFANTGGSCEYIECEAYACNAANTASVGGFTANAPGGNVYTRCISHDNSGNANLGFMVASGGNTFIECITDTNGKAGWAMTAANIALYLSGCTAYGNTTDGVQMGSNTCVLVADNCTFANNLGWGVNSTGTSSIVRLSNCGFYLNSLGQVTGAVDDTGRITYASQPMNDPANGDFTPILATARGAGRGVFTQDSGSYTKTSVSYPDVGAVQSQALMGDDAGVVNLGMMEW